MTRGRLTAYLRYQVLDFLILRAALPVALVVLMGTMFLKTGRPPESWAGAREQMFLTQIFRILSGMFITLAPFIAVTRLITDDRANGHFRFLFSKPVSIERFYIQQWVLHGAGLVVLAGLLALLLQAVTATVPVGAAMAMTGLTWLLVGGVGFALTAASNQDTILLVVAYVVSTVLHSVKDAVGSPMPGWLRQVTRVTLPTQKLDYIRDQLYAGNEVPWEHVAHVAGYGLVAFAVAIVVLRRSSFAR
jgi:hypothetical protein